MLNKSILVFVVSRLILCAASGLLGQSLLVSSLPAQTEGLPQGMSVKDTGPRTYRFIVDYNTANTKGEMVYRQRMAGEYTRGLAGGEVEWKNVTKATAVGPTAPFGAPQKSDIMEAFRYRNDLGNALNPGFFKGFPPTAVLERNLVWDTKMIEYFGQDFFEHLKLNEPYHTGADKDVVMPDVGTAQLRDIVLEWIGRSQRNGQDCALIKYQGFFNPLEIANGGMTLIGRSDFWGEIWVSVETKQIEYATLQEVVVGEMKLPGQDTTQVINVLRIGSFELVSAK
jgi:hypothetical protein